MRVTLPVHLEDEPVDVLADELVAPATTIENSETYSTSRPMAVRAAYIDSTFSTPARSSARRSGQLVVVVKHKGETSVYSSRSERPYVTTIEPLERDDVVDDTGAGDVFAAGFPAARVSPVVQGRLGARLCMEAAREMLMHVGPPSHSAVSDTLDRLAGRLAADRR